MKPTQAVKVSNEQLLGLLQRHLVALLVRVRVSPKAPLQTVAYTCFVLEMAEQRWLATAGHILKDLYGSISKYAEVSADIFDDWDHKAESIPIPFDLKGTTHVEIDQDGLDIGLIRLDDYYWRMLATNGILSFSERTWKEPDELSAFVVQGLPTQLISEDVDAEGALTINLSQALVRLDRVSPPEVMKTSFPRFFGKLADKLIDKTGEELREMDGLSGAPIIGLREDAAGKKYFLVAIQSGWRRDERVLAGPLISEVAKLVAAKQSV